MTQDPRPPPAPEPSEAGHALQLLGGGRYLSVTTFRRDGRTVSTPVWFLLAHGQLWARSAADSGKVKRIRRDPRVRLAPCDRHGTETAPPMDATAAVLQREDHPQLYRALLRRYGPTATLYDLYWTRARRTRTVLLRFTLHQDPRTPTPP